MTVTAQSTRISISGTDLAQAAFPVTVDPEIGTNDFRISDAGGTGVETIDASSPAVTYNSTNNEYLMVWQADDTDEAGIVDGEQEIFGQRFSLPTTVIPTMPEWAMIIFMILTGMMAVYYLKRVKISSYQLSINN